jgi:hypothetical protein
MLIPRKITFQLTPLLDLLLIVIFAQYLDVRNKTARGEQDAAEQSAAMQDDVRKAQRDRDRFQGRLADANAALRKRQADIGRLDELLRKQQAADEAAAKKLRQQRDDLARMLAEMFRLPPQAVKQALKPLAAADNPRRAEELRKIRERLKKLQAGKAHQIVRHVVKYEELLKRCDIWEVHLSKTYNVSVTAGDSTHHFRITAREPRRTSDEDAARRELQRFVRDLAKDFEAKLFKYFKGLPQPKSVVIVLVSHDGNDLSTFAAVKQGVQLTSDHVSTNTGARVNMVVADLGTLQFEDQPEQKSP